MAEFQLAVFVETEFRTSTTFKEKSPNIQFAICTFAYRNPFKGAGFNSIVHNIDFLEADLEW